MTEKQYNKLRAKIDVLDGIYDDLPDGAYFAVMEENGVDVYDFAEIAEYEIANDVDNGIMEEAKEEVMSKDKGRKEKKKKKKEK